MRIKLNSGITRVSDREDAPSAQEIRNKFEQRNIKNRIGAKKVEETKNPAKAGKDKVEISKEAKDKSAKSKKVDNEEAKEVDKQSELETNKEENEDFELGDIKKNDPKDPVTKEKLKDVLRNGSFHFSAAERAALGEILEE